jgi:glutamate racemase
MSSLNDLKCKSITRLGVFDSGLGGLTVLKELLNHHPDHDYIYFGDTAHVPYGSREAEDVVGLVTEIARYLVAQGCQGLILACNTSSALALSALRATVDVPVLGVIGTASIEAARVTRGTVAVLANPLTAHSEVYSQSIQKEAQILGRSQPTVVEIGCPDLVPIVENDLLHTQEAGQILEGYARQISEAGADTLVLGCTHYPLLLPVLGPLLGADVSIVNPAGLLPNYLKKLNGTEPGQLEFRVSGEPLSFDAPASKILGRPVRSQRVSLTRPVYSN